MAVVGGESNLAGHEPLQLALDPAAPTPPTEPVVSCVFENTSMVGSRRMPIREAARLAARLAACVEHRWSASWHARKRRGGHHISLASKNCGTTTKPSAAKPACICRLLPTNHHSAHAQSILGNPVSNNKGRQPQQQRPTTTGLCVCKPPGDGAGLANLSWPLSGWSAGCGPAAAGCGEGARCARTASSRRAIPGMLRHTNAVRTGEDWALAGVATRTLVPQPACSRTSSVSWSLTLQGLRPSVVAMADWVAYMLQGRGAVPRHWG